MPQESRNQTFNFSFSGFISRGILQETTGKSYSSCVVEMTKWNTELSFNQKKNRERKKKKKKKKAAAIFMVLL